MIFCYSDYRKKKKSLINFFQHHICVLTFYWSSHAKIMQIKVRDLTLMDSALNDIERSTIFTSPCNLKILLLVENLAIC